MKKNNLSAGNQMAHVCNRMFTNLEGKGILRSGVEEVSLASEYNPSDELSAEFIRTFRHEYFFGKYYLDRYRDSIYFFVLSILDLVLAVLCYCF